MLIYLLLKIGNLHGVSYETTYFQEPCIFSSFETGLDFSFEAILEMLFIFVKVRAMLKLVRICIPLYRLTEVQYY